METTTNPMHPYAPPALVPSSGSSEVTTTTAPGSDWMGSKLMTVENPLSIDYTQALTKEEDEIHPVVVSGGDGGGGHDDHHAEIAPTKVPEWIGNIIEKVFKVKKRGTTVEMECYCGLVQFISCLYVLPVVPFQMKRVGYDETSSIVATTVTCAIGSIASSFLTDMPLIIAPPTSVSIFLAVSMQQSNFSKDEGCAAVILSGASLVVIGALPPVARFISKLIPDCIQAATSVGIGLITALAGCIESTLDYPSPTHAFPHSLSHHVMIHIPNNVFIHIISFAASNSRHDGGQGNDLIFDVPSNCLTHSSDMSITPTPSIPSLPLSLHPLRCYVYSKSGDQGQIHDSGHGRYQLRSDHCHRLTHPRHGRTPLPHQGGVLRWPDIRHLHVVDLFGGMAQRHCRATRNRKYDRLPR